MNRFFKFKALAAAMVLTSSVANAQVFIKYENIPGGGYGSGGDWFVADSFSFGVEREMKESGEKAGTADINIGVGELQELQIRKAMDASSPELARLSITGYSLGDAEVCVTDNPDAPTGCYLRYVLERCFVKSWSTSGDADNRPTEEVAFYYNKIAFSYASTRSGAKTWDATGTMSWDNTTNTKWSTGEMSLSNAD